MQSFTSHNVVIVPVISKNYLIILSVYLTFIVVILPFLIVILPFLIVSLPFLVVIISASRSSRHTSPNSDDIIFRTGSGKSPLSSGCFASGIPQGRHLQMPGRSWRAGQPSGDGKPAQLRVIRKRNSSGKASSDAGPELAGRAVERRWKARRP